MEGGGRERQAAGRQWLEGAFGVCVCVCVFVCVCLCVSGGVGPDRKYILPYLFITANDLCLSRVPHELFNTQP